VDKVGFLIKNSFAAPLFSQPLYIATTRPRLNLVRGRFPFAGELKPASNNAEGDNTKRIGDIHTDDRIREADICINNVIALTVV
jgi:hypothetical protein